VHQQGASEAAQRQVALQMVINTGIGHCSSISHLTANGHHLLRVLSVGWPHRELPAQAMLLVLFDIWGCQLFKYLLIESGEYKHRSKLSHFETWEQFSS
jgi:hypothetical protein